MARSLQEAASVCAFEPSREGIKQRRRVPKIVPEMLMPRLFIISIALLGVVGAQAAMTGDEVLQLRALGVSDAALTAHIRRNGLTTAAGLLWALEETGAAQDLRDLAAVHSPRRMQLAQLVKDFEEAEFGDFSLLAPRGWGRMESTVQGGACATFANSDGLQRITVYSSAVSVFTEAAAAEIGVQLVERVLQATESVAATTRRGCARSEIEGRVWASAAATQAIPRGPSREVSVLATVIAGRAVVCVAESIVDAQQVKRPLEVMLGSLTLR